MNPFLDSYKYFVVGLCYQLKVNTILEIGLGHDAAAVDYILNNYKEENFHIYCIEPFLNKLALQNLSKYDNRKYTIFNGFSQDKRIYKELLKIDLVLIDGDHHYESVFNDIKICKETNILENNSIIIIHDTDSEQIERAILDAERILEFKYLIFPKCNIGIGRF